MLLTIGKKWINLLLILGVIIEFGFTTTIDTRESIAKVLTERYSDTLSDCRGKPAYYCSGVMLRSVVMSDAYHEWDPSPTSITTGGISFSYLRSDMRITELFHNVGFIFKNQDNVSNDEMVTYNCAYPIDAWTDKRKNGCGTYGSSKNNIQDVSTCGSYGVTDLSSWLNYWNNIPGGLDSKQKGQCSLSTQDKDAFKIMMSAHDSVAGTHWNEVIIGTWKKGQKLPIEAFFYINGAANALADVLKLKQEYKTETGFDIPIVKITLGNSVVFEDYNDDPGPSPETKCHDNMKIRTLGFDNPYPELGPIKLRYECGGPHLLTMEGSNGHNRPDKLAWKYINYSGQEKSGDTDVNNIYLESNAGTDFELTADFDDFGPSVHMVIRAGKYSSSGYIECEVNGLSGCAFE